MPRQRPQIRINPIDTKPNVAVGISIPFNGTPVFNSTYTTKDQVRSNLINYFLTNKGERLFNPNFGGDLRASLFEQETDFDQLHDFLTTQMELYFPQITVNNINIDINSDTQAISISIDYSINNDQDNVQFQIEPQ